MSSTSAESEVELLSDFDLWDCLHLSNVKDDANSEVQGHGMSPGLCVDDGKILAVEDDQQAMVSNAQSATVSSN